MEHPDQLLPVLRAQAEGGRMNMTPCFISEMPGEKTKALLVGFYQKAWTHDASPLIGGFPAGQIAYPVAVVLLESGDVVTVNAEAVTISAPEEMFRQYVWIGSED
jgi:hypothetical protein